MQFFNGHGSYSGLVNRAMLAIVILVSSLALACRSETEPPPDVAVPTTTVTESGAAETALVSALQPTEAASETVTTPSATTVSHGFSPTPDSRAAVVPGMTLSHPVLPTPTPLYLSAWKAIAEANQLEETKPTLADTLVALPWVEDGVDDGEMAALGELVRVELMHGQESRAAMADRDWVVDGVGESELSLIAGILELGAYEDIGGEHLLALPFLDSIEEADVETVAEFNALAESSSVLFSSVLAKPWVSNGFDESEKEVLGMLRSLALTEPEAAFRLADIPFLNDAGPVDVRAIGLLAGLAETGSELFDALLAKLWVQDGLEADEVTVLEILETVASRDEGTELQLIALPFLDELDSSDIDTIHRLDLLARGERTRPLYGALLQRWWIGDGMEEDEVALVDTLEILATTTNGTELVVIDMPFLETFESSDLVTAGELARLSTGEQSLLATLIEKPWVTDGLSEFEVIVTGLLRELSEYDLSRGHGIATMPFLDTFEQEDLDTATILVSLGLGEQDGTSSLPFIWTAWIVDGLDPLETEVVERLLAMEEQVEEAGAMVAVMPFLSTIEEADLNTVAVLESLSQAEHSQDLLFALVGEPWLADGLNQLESIAVEELASLAGTGKMAEAWIAGMTGVSGGDASQEKVTFRRYDASRNGEIEYGEVLNAVESYLNGSLDDNGLATVVALFGFHQKLAPPPTITELMEAAYWYQNGLNYDDIYGVELRAASVLTRVDRHYPEMVDRLSRWGWPFDGQITGDEAGMLEYIVPREEKYSGLRQVLIDLPWVADGADAPEIDALGGLHGIAWFFGDEFAREMATAPWFTDGITLEEGQLGLTTLSHFTHSVSEGQLNRETFLKLSGLLGDYPENTHFKLLRILHSVMNIWPSGFRKLVNEALGSRMAWSRRKGCTSSPRWGSLPRTSGSLSLPR